MGNIFKCKDKDGVDVVCHESTWNNHIISDHPELKDCENVVIEAIGSPYRIYEDCRNPKRKIIYKPFVLPKPFNTYYLRICIEYHTRMFGGKRGYVVTAFSAQGIKKGDKLEWQQAI